MPGIHHGMGLCKRIRHWASSSRKLLRTACQHARSWLLHKESWAAPRRAHAPLHRNHGISPARCLWQLQCHRKVRTGETRRECKGGSAGPAYAAGGPSQEDRTARVSTNRTLTRAGASPRQVTLRGCFHGFCLVPACLRTAPPLPFCLVVKTFSIPFF
ncbi:biogenesis of lysosome-related organelles complex 1 subunit 6 isoform X2 [Panthera tigris]|uniref:biogenesis of lysosome-related organelles complex 1 subunit 6 isoform X2 n=1 Tax=Panthera tigris TaxID=9694 RepID=UPI001C6FC0F9|nr:biogenesis of lysosome-related organelles complex 1 subunit 6 isoform X2 [Panthera tigris]